MTLSECDPLREPPNEPPPLAASNFAVTNDDDGAPRGEGDLVGSNDHRARGVVTDPTAVAEVAEVITEVALASFTIALINLNARYAAVAFTSDT